MDNCIFCQIANKEVAKEFTYQDEDVMVFPDIHPVKPLHLLIVPKKHIAEFTAVRDIALHSKIAQVINQLILQNNLTDNGYRIVVNGGGAQVVNHLHYHLMGPMGRAVAV
jgi:histidine triad (HIT) family protein